MQETVFGEDFIETCSCPTGQQREFYDSSFQLSGSFGLRVSQAGKKSFFLIYSLAGKRKRITLGRHPQLTLWQAREKAEELLRQVERGADPAAEQKDAKSRPRFKEVSELCFEKLLKEGRSERTIAEYRRIATKELFPLFGDRQLHKITEGEFSQVLEKIAIEREALSYSNRVRSVLNSLYKYAEEAKLSSHNPITEILRFDENSAEKKTTITLSSLQELYKETNSLRPEAMLLIKFMLLSAQKASSCINARWSDISLGTWNVNGKKKHRIHLNKGCTQLLHRSKALQAAKGIESRYLFVSPRGKRFDSIRHYTGTLLTDKKHLPKNLREVQSSLTAALSSSGIRSDIAQYIRGSISQHSSTNELEYYYGASAKALETWSKALQSTNKKSKVIELFSEEP